MATIKDLAETLNLVVAAGQKGVDREAACGYCGDLLSEVMANAPEKSIWMTVQTHQNIVAVAVLREMAAVVLTGGQRPDEETVEKAEQEGIPILLWPGSSYDLAVKLYQAGVPASQERSG